MNASDLVRIQTLKFHSNVADGAVNLKHDVERVAAGPDAIVPPRPLFNFTRINGRIRHGDALRNA